MDPALVNLIAASTAFVGTHFVLSHPLRARLVSVVGEKGFAGLYSLVGLATFAWMVWAFIVTPLGSPLWDGSGEAIWAVASVLTVVALALFLGSLRGNPALPDPRAGQDLASKQPAHVFRVTRHPMMWGFAIWALAHILVSPTGRTLVLAGAIGLLALVGAHLQDRKKQILMGDGWRMGEQDQLLAAAECTAKYRDGAMGDCNRAVAGNHVGAHLAGGYPGRDLALAGITPVAVSLRRIIRPCKPRTQQKSGAETPLP